MRDHLASLVLQKDKEIIDLNRKMAGMMNKIDNQTEEISGLKQEVNGLHQTIDENNFKIDGLQQEVKESNFKIDGLQQTIGKVVKNVKYLASSSIEFQQEVRYRDTKLINHINTKFQKKL